MSEKLKMLKKALDGLIVKAEDNQQYWISAGNNNSDEALVIWKKTLTKIDELKIEIEKEEKIISDRVIDENNNITSVNNLNNESIDFEKKIEVLKNKIQIYSATTKDALDFLELRNKLLSKLIDDTDQLLLNSRVLSEVISDSLFYNIIDSETLTDTVKIDINKVREKNEDRESKNTFNWWQRYLVVSALTISIIKYSKFDYRKADYLIDFISDREDKVWENALVGLCISLSYRDKKWNKYDNLIKKLKGLQSDEIIQNGLNKIEQIWRIGLFKNNFLPNRINEIDFFDNKPHNWFLPFYENNPTLLDSLESCQESFDSEPFLKFIYNFPIIDSYKYLLCHYLSRGDIYKLDSSNKKDIRIIQIMNSMANISYLFSPFQNIMSTLYQFFNFYSEEQFKDLFNKKKSLIESDLRDTILHNKQKLLIRATNSIENNNFILAKKELKELLSIDEENHQALFLIITCIESDKHKNEIEEKEAYLESLTYWDKLETFFPDNITILTSKRNSYNSSEQFSKSLEYSLKLEDFEPEEISHKCFSTYLYAKLEMTTQFNKKINEIDFDKLDKPIQFALIGAAYGTMNNFLKQIEFGFKVLDIEKLNPKSIDQANLCNVFYACIVLKNMEKASILHTLIESELNDERFLSLIGYYFLLKKEIDKANSYYLRLLNLYENNINYYNLQIMDFKGIAIWELAKNETENAVNTFKMILYCYNSFEKFKIFFQENYNDLLDFSDYNTLNEILKIIEDYWIVEGKHFVYNQSIKKSKNKNKKVAN